MLKKVMTRMMALLLAAAPFLGLGTGEAIAATSRVAVIQSLSGTVEVQKSGGSKVFKAFAKMSLNEGDILTTGANSSAVLQFGNGNSADDKMTVSANSKLTFSKLTDRGGTRTKVSMFNGSAWVDVKSIASKNDEFTLETPTAIMGVRGTHLLVSVDPETGSTRLAVAAGVVTAQNQNGDSQAVKPGDEALLTKNELGGGELMIAPADLDTLIAQSDNTIVEAIIAAAGEIALENQQKLDEYFDGEADDASDLERLKSNVENLLGAIVDAAVTSGKISQDRVEELVAIAQQQTGAEIDLSKKTRTLTEEERLKQEAQKQQEAAAAAAAQAKREADEAQRMQQEALLAELEAQRQQAAEEAQRLLEEKRQKALEAYESQLSEEEKQRFLEAQQQLDQPAGASPSATSSPTADSGTGGGSAPGPTNYRIIYDANGGTGAVPVDGTTYAPGDTAIVKDQGELSKPGHLFAGWLVEGTDELLQPESTIVIENANVKLYAQWEYDNPLAHLEIIYAVETSNEEDHFRQLEGINLNVMEDSNSLPYLYPFGFSWPGSMNLGIAAVPKNPQAHVVLKANGVPLEGWGPEQILYEGNNGEIGDSFTIFEGRLFGEYTLLEFEVYENIYADPRIYKLHLNHPAEPDDLEWWASKTTFESVGPNRYAGVVAEEVVSESEPVTFEFQFKYSNEFDVPSIYVNEYRTTAILEHVSTEGDEHTAHYSISLKDNGIHHLNLVTEKNGLIYEFEFNVLVGDAQPPWSTTSSPFMLYLGMETFVPVEWTDDGLALEATLGFNAGYVELQPIWTYDMRSIRSVWDEARRVAMQTPYYSEFNEALAYPIEVYPGNNEYWLYVSDESGYFNETIRLNIYKSDYLTGITDISVEYKPSGSTESTVSSAELHPFFNGARYVKLPDTGGEIQLNLDVDGSFVEYVTLSRVIPQEQYWTEQEIDSQAVTDSRVSFNLGSPIEPTMEHFNDYRVCLAPIGAQYMNCFQMVVIAEDIDAKQAGLMHVGSSFTIYSGPHLSVVELDEITQEVEIVMDYNASYVLVDKYGAIYSGFENWFYVYPATGVNTYYVYDWLKENIVHTITIYKQPYELPPSFNLTDIGVTEDVYYSVEEWGLDVEMPLGAESLTIHPQLPPDASANAKIVGVYTFFEKFGEAEGSDGTYEILMPSYVPYMYVYIVIQDDDYIKPIELILRRM